MQTVARRHFGREKQHFKKRNSIEAFIFLAFQLFLRPQSGNEFLLTLLGRIWLSLEHKLSTATFWLRFGYILVAFRSLSGYSAASKYSRAQYKAPSSRLEQSASHVVSHAARLLRFACMRTRSNSQKRKWLKTITTATAHTARELREISERNTTADH